VRDKIGADGKFGEIAAMEANDALAKVKNAYIDIYFNAHKKRRLTAAEYKSKVALMDSSAFANLTRLSAIDEILSVAKLKNIETDLAALIAAGYNSPQNAQNAASYAEKILTELEDDIGWAYKTRHTNGTDRYGRINYAVWSDVLICPNCGKELVYYNIGIDSETGHKAGKKYDVTAAVVKGIHKNFHALKACSTTRCQGEISGQSKRFLF
jgi:hypothetical protein